MGLEQKMETLCFIKNLTRQVLLIISIYIGRMNIAVGPIKIDIIGKTNRKEVIEKKINCFFLNETTNIYI